MRFWEAMKHLEEGKKVRGTSWTKGTYIQKPDHYDGLIKDQEGEDAIVTSFHTSPEWELFVEEEESSEMYLWTYKKNQKWYVGLELMTKRRALEVYGEDIAILMEHTSL